MTRQTPPEEGSPCGAPNEIDFWRGFALADDFHQSYSGALFRALHLSQFLAFGFGRAFRLSRRLGHAQARREPERRGCQRSGSCCSLEAAPSRSISRRVVHRAIRRSRCSRRSSILLDAPFLLDWHNASAVFNDPARAQIGLVLLTHQLGYFNILPLYVVLLVIAPIFVLLQRKAAVWTLPTSLAIYVCALGFGVNFRTWPVEGSWFFNPLAWQLIYVLGFLLAGRDGVGAFARRAHRPLRLLAFLIVLLGVVVTLADLRPDPIAVPSPKLFFLFDKTFLSPARLIHSLALIALFAGSFGWIAARASAASNFLTLLGRNSLNVFCASSLLSLLGQLARFLYGDVLAADAAIVILGVLTLGLVAWFSEWPDNSAPVWQSLRLDPGAHARIRLRGGGRGGAGPSGAAVEPGLRGAERGHRAAGALAGVQRRAQGAPHGPRPGDRVLVDGRDRRLLRRQDLSAPVRSHIGAYAERRRHRPRHARRLRRDRGYRRRADQQRSRVAKARSRAVATRHQ